MEESPIPPDHEQIRCARCTQTKPADDFKWIRKKTVRRDNLCRPCRQAYQHEHYLANRQRYIENAGKRRRKAKFERMSYLLEFFSTHPCVDCGEADASVLEFDHLGGKSFNISKGFRDRSWEDVLAEIAKCEVRCANCHRRRTAESRGWYRALLCGDALDAMTDAPASVADFADPSPTGTGRWAQS